MLSLAKVSYVTGPLVVFAPLTPPSDSAAVLTLVSFAQATITIDQPNIQGNATNTIKWTSTDPNNDAEVFSIELINPGFNRQFAIANNVQTSQGSVSFEWPALLPR